MQLADVEEEQCPSGAMGRCEKCSHYRGSADSEVIVLDTAGNNCERVRTEDGQVGYLPNRLSEE